MATGALLANMGMYLVIIPEGREPFYEWAAPLFLSLAIASAGLWVACRRRFRPPTRRALLWACSGTLSISYSAWWVWEHRDVFVWKTTWAGWIAVNMDWLWIVFFFAVVMIRSRMGKIARLPEDIEEARPNEPADPPYHAGSRAPEVNPLGSSAASDSDTTTLRAGSVSDRRVGPPDPST